FKTTLYAAADARKLASRRQFHEREARVMEPILESGAESAAITDELQAQVHVAMAGLGSTDRETLVLRYLRGLSTTEVAAALGTTEVVVRKRVSRALERLRKQFLSRGGVAVGLLVAGLEGLKAHGAPPDFSAHMQSIVLGK